MKPSIGRVVHVIGPRVESNGADVAPAIITRVWSETCANVTAFPDCGVSQNLTSVRLVADEQAARDINAQAEHPQSLAFWPPRV